MSDTGLIEAASGQCRTMADGTLRIWFDVEPRHAADAFRLFSAPGTPAVLGRLQVPAESPAPAPAPAQQRERMGPLCELAVMLCKTPEFQDWASHQHAAGGGQSRFNNMADEARGVILALCGVTSRKHLDTSREAAARFHQLVRLPYLQWHARRQEGVPA